MKNLTLLTNIFLITLLLVFVSSLEANATIRQVFIPHDELVTQVEWSPDGSKLAIMSFSQIRIFDTETWNQIGIISDSYVYDFSWHPNSQYIAGVRGGLIEGIIIWDVETEMMLGEYSRDLYKDGGIIILHTIAWHPEASYIVTDTIDYPDEILIWDLSQQENQISYERDFADENGVTHNILELSWNSDGSLLLSTGLEDTMGGFPTTRILDLTSRTPLVSFNGFKAVWGLDNNLIANASFMNYISQITIWNIWTETPMLVFNKHTSIVSSIAWNYESNVIASVDVDDNLYIWNAETGIVYNIDAIYQKDIRYLVWQPESDVIAIASASGVLVREYAFPE